MLWSFKTLSSFSPPFINYTLLISNLINVCVTCCDNNHNRTNKDDTYQCPTHCETEWDDEEVYVRFTQREIRDSTSLSCTGLEDNYPRASTTKQLPSVPPPFPTSFAPLPDAPASPAQTRSFWLSTKNIQTSEKALRSSLSSSFSLLSSQLTAFVNLSRADLELLSCSSLTSICSLNLSFSILDNK